MSIWSRVFGGLSLAMVCSAGAQAACPAIAPGTTQRVEIGQPGRWAQVHVPAGHDAAKPAPILILLHGSRMTGAQMLKASKLEATSDKAGFVVVAPDAGIPVDNAFVWNIPGVPTVTGKVPGEGDADDVAYLTALAGELAKSGCGDPARIYLSGLSGGGRMASWMGCVRPEVFAAIAPVVGLRAGNPDPKDTQRPDPKSCTPKRPIPVVAFAGDKDTVNPIQGGGTGYWQYPMHVAEQRWAQLNGCTTAPTTVRIDARVYEERYTGCRDGAEVVARITEGGTHEWLADNDALWALVSLHTRR